MHLAGESQSNRDRAPELFRVEVTEGGKGYWKYYFRSLIGNHSTSMEATDALGCRYQLARWDRETEQELTSASPT